MLTPEIIAKMLDHSTLQPWLTEADIRRGCEIALRYKTATVCARPGDMKLVSQLLEGSGVLPCTVIGFPHGAHHTSVKVFEAQRALDDGCRELDMVINIGWAKAKRYEDILREINAVKDACGGKLLKVIIETCLLTEEEKIALCDVVSHSRAEFIKTSTGFAGGGATLEDIQLFKKYVTGDTKIKAAGGIKSVADAEAFLAAGADRLGTSSLLAMLKKEIET